MRAPGFFLLATLALIPRPAAAALSAEYDYWVRLNDTIGADSCVKLQELTGDWNTGFTLRLDVCSQEKAEGLSHILKHPQFAGEGGDLPITLQLAPPTGEPLGLQSSATATKEQVIGYFEHGLTGNPYFVAVDHPDDAFPPLTWVEFKAVLIQMKLDDATDLYGLSNFTAEEAFCHVLSCGASYGSVDIAATTTPLPHAGG